MVLSLFHQFMTMVQGPEGRVETSKEGDCHMKALETRGWRITVGLIQGEILVVLGG